MEISNCCGALPCGETFEGMGFCSDCHEHATFEEDENIMTKMVKEAIKHPKSNYATADKMVAEFVKENE